MSLLNKKRNMSWRKIFSTYSNLPKTIYYLFFVRIIISLGYFVFPFITLFFTKILLLPAEKVGIYLMIVEIGRVLGNLLGGKMSDGYGRKIVLIICLTLTAMFLLPCAFLGESPLIALLLITASFFNGATTPSLDVMLVDLSNVNNRNTVYSFSYLGLNLGLAFGAAIAGFLFNNYMKLLFIGNVLAIVLAITIVYLFIPETFVKEEKEDSFILKNKNTKNNLLSFLIKQPNVLFFFLSTTILNICVTQLMFGLPLQLNDLFLKEGPKIYGIVLSFNCFIFVMMSIPVSYFSKNNKPTINIVLSGILFAIGFGMYHWVSSLILILLFTFVWTIGEILLRVNSGVYIANQSPYNLRGRYNSLISLSINIARMISPPVVGYIIAGYGIRSVWIFVLILSFLGFIFMYLIFLYEVKNDSYQKIPLVHKNNF